MALDYLSIIAHDATEAAYLVAKKRKKYIHKAVAYWNQSVAKKFTGKKSLLKNLEAAFLKHAKTVPQTLAEIHAIAQGADLPFADVFRLNLTELMPFAEKCTTVIVPFVQNNKKHILIAHNEDWDPRRNDVFLLHVTLPTLSYKIVAYNGYLPGLSCGVNSLGLTHAVNYVRPTDLRPGVPRIFITRHLITAENIPDCLSWIRAHHRAFGQSIHLAQGTRYLGVEITAQKISLRHPELPTAHANHYLSPTLKPWARPASPSSLLRQERAEEILQSFRTKKNLSRHQAQKIARTVLSDTQKHPCAIWRHFDPPFEESATLVTAFLTTADQHLITLRGSPD